MVAAVMVMTIAITAIAGVPDVLELFESLWLRTVHSFHQVFVHLFAVMHTFGFDLKCFVEKIISTCDEIDEISDGSWSMRSSVEMNMDAASVIGHTAGFTQATYNILQCSNIFLIS